jgi:hypothetical protein
MRTTLTVAHLVVRVLGPILILLGLVFWTGNALVLVPVHMLLGLVLVLALWTIAAREHGHSRRLGRPPRLVSLVVLLRRCALGYGSPRAWASSRRHARSPTTFCAWRGPS